MPGRIMTAQQAVKEYGSQYKSIKRRGNKVSLKNSDGRRITVGKNDKVYHRGKGNFAPYSAARDARKVSRGATTLGGKGAIGTGKYRQTSDYRKKRR